MMKNNVMPISNVKLGREEMNRIMLSAKRKAGLPETVTGRRTVPIAGAAAALCVIIIGAVIVVPDFGRDDSQTAEKEKRTEMVLEDGLNIGRYYLNGNINEHYIEVYDDGTLQWKGFDVESWVREITGAALDNPEIPKSEETYSDLEQGIMEQVAWCESRHRYTVVSYNRMGITMVLLDDDDPSDGGTGCSYIDRNTIEWNGFTFVYIG